MLESDTWKKQFEEFLKSGWTIGAIMQNKWKDIKKSPDNAMKDEDIIKIHEDLQNAKSIEDLMN